MTNSVQVFNFENSSIRTTIIEDTPYFVAKDIASLLDVKNSRDVISNLDQDEKGVGLIDTPGGRQKMNVISESGVYAFIGASRKPAAENAKRWLRKEVLPSIRKTGGYQVKQMTPMELLETQYEALKDVDAAQKELRNEFTDLKEQFGLPNDFRKRFTKARNKRVIEIMGGYYGTAYGNKKLRSAVYRELSNYVKDRFQIGEYANLPLSRFDEAMRLIGNWQPSEVTSLAIEGANQTVLEV